MSKQFAFVFPGQGSQALKMMDNLADFAIIKQTFAQANSVLGIDFWAMLQEENADNINQTLNTQPLLLTASYATYLLWLEQSSGKLPNVVAGHSLGEYSALVASGVIDFASALHLVRKRAEYMQQAVASDQGAMAAVVGLADAQVIASCAEVMGENLGVVQAVNFNSPGQVVIAGDKLAVAKASEVLKANGARKIVPLAVSVPSHCDLMRPAAEKLAMELAQIEFKAPQIPVLQNVNGQISNDGAQLKQGLIQQLYLPVLWTQSVEKLASSQIDIIVECGPGKVLSGLNKRIHAQASLFNLHKVEDFSNLHSALSAE